MAEPNYYRILGVRADASHTEIRQAYIRLSKMQHPDQFNPLTQPEEWQRANDRLRELNDAYGNLRGDRTRQRAASQQAAESQRAPPRPPPPSTPLGPLKAGIAFWDSMNLPLRARLVDRQEGKVSPQFHYRFKEPKANLAGLILPVLWLAFLGVTVRSALWTDEATTIFIGASGAAALIFAWSFARALRARSCGLGNNVLVTPLYLIRTRLDQVRYYPVWELTEVSQTDRRRFGCNWGSVVELKFKSGYEQIKFPTPAIAKACTEALRLFNQKVEEAKTKKDLAFFSAEDDFREPPLQDVKLRRLEPPAVAGWVFLFLALFVGGAIGLQFYNDLRPVKRIAITALAPGAGASLAAASGRGTYVDFDTDPPGAIVQENRADLGRTPLHLTGQAPGHHRYILKYADWAPQECDLDLTNVPQQIKYAWPHGSVHLETTPAGARVSAGGQDLGVTPLSLPAVPVGHAAYTVALEGFSSAAVAGEVEDGRTLELSAQLAGAAREAGIRVKLGADHTRVSVSNSGDQPIQVQKASLYDADYKLKDSIAGPWSVAPGAEVTLTFHQARADFDFYSFVTEPKDLPIEIVK